LVANWSNNIPDITTSRKRGGICCGFVVRN